MATRIPGGKSTVTPYVAAKGAAAFLEFVERTFGTDPALRVLNEDGTIGHSEVTIGDSVIMAFDAHPDWPDTPSFLSVYVDDVDEVVARAVAAGAVVITEVTTSRIVGDRGGRISDPVGNIWWIRPTSRTSTRRPCASCSPTPGRPPRCGAAGVLRGRDAPAGGALTFGGREDRAFMVVVTIMKTRSWGVVGSGPAAPSSTPAGRRRPPRPPRRPWPGSRPAPRRRSTR